MIYLLDTHAFIWTVLETSKLGKKAKEIISCMDNEICVSTVSFWEISLKTNNKKFILENINIKDFPGYAKDLNFQIIDMLESESITFHELPPKQNHKDPFDRMLIWQAINYGMTMISRDSMFEQYKEDGLKLVW